MALAFYRKYRPQKFAEVIGQEGIVSVLQKSLKSNKIHHAYLFVGSRGTGKTSTARILAKSVNCPQFDNDQVEPCGKCDVCTGIEVGSFLDLLEIDAASNRGIDDIRDLREKIKLSPTEGKYKVYIIDEVHMLTTEAFNALLKTLEEPPAHALFVLCTTDPQKLPATIVSRCMKLEFRRPDISELKKKLGSIADREKVKVSDEIYEAVASVSGGAYRDAEVMLEKVISELGEKIGKADLEAVQKILGTSSKDSATDFLGLILQNKSSEALGWLDSYTQSGGDPKVLNINLLESTRYLLLVKLGMGETMVKSGVSPVAYEFLLKYSEKIDKDKIIDMYNIFTQAYESIKLSPIPVLPLEVSIAQMTSISTTLKPVSTPIPKPKEVEVVVEAEPVVVEVVTEPDKEVRNTTDILLDEIKTRWPEVTKTIRAASSTLYTILSSCELKEYDGKTLVVSVPYAFHKDRLEENKNRKAVEKVVSDLIGADIKIRGIIGQRPKRDMSAQDIANVEVIKDEEIVEAALDIFNSGLTKE